MAEEEKKELTRDEVIKWYKDEIEIATLRRDLSVLQAEAVEAEAKRYQAAMMIGQIKMAEEEMEKEMAGQAEVPPMAKVGEEG